MEALCLIFQSQPVSDVLKDGALQEIGILEEVCHVFSDIHHIAGGISAFERERAASVWFQKGKDPQKSGFAASVGADYAGNAAFADPQIVDIKGLGPFPIAVGEISYLINDPWSHCVSSGHCTGPSRILCRIREGLCRLNLSSCPVFYIILDASCSTDPSWGRREVLRTP